LARVREKSGLTKQSNFGVGSIFENINHRNLFASCQLIVKENLELPSDALSLKLEFEGMEARVGPYRVDIVAHEALTGSRAVIENQLERTDHDFGLSAKAGCDLLCGL
jgi:hypothetical protein